MSEYGLTEYGLNRSSKIDTVLIDNPITSDLVSYQIFSDRELTSYDPTVTMVNNIDLSIPDVVVGNFLSFNKLLVSLFIKVLLAFSYRV